LLAIHTQKAKVPIGIKEAGCLENFEKVVEGSRPNTKILKYEIFFFGIELKPTRELKV
jgi:hypothetical protein